MSLAKVSIEVEREPLVATDVARGLVLIDAAQEIDVRDVTLTLGWRTSGRGDVDQRDLVEQELAGAMTLPVGETAFDFECEVPHGPMTYTGTMIKIRWQFEVRLDRTGWLKRDVAKKRVVVVVAPESGSA